MRRLHSSQTPNDQDVPVAGRSRIARILGAAQVGDNVNFESLPKQRRSELVRVMVSCGLLRHAQGPYVGDAGVLEKLRALQASHRPSTGGLESSTEHILALIASPDVVVSKKDIYACLGNSKRHTERALRLLHEMGVVCTLRGRVFGRPGRGYCLPRRLSRGLRAPLNNAAVPIPAAAQPPQAHQAQSGTRGGPGLVLEQTPLQESAQQTHAHESDPEEDDLDLSREYWEECEREARESAARRGE